MSDLISKEEAMNIIQEELSLRWGHDTDIALFSVKKKISELPTAFDTENVIEQLEEAKDGICLNEDDLDIYCVALDKAIDIVKKGGVE